MHNTVPVGDNRSPELTSTTKFNKCEYMKQWRAAKKQAGICPRCGCMPVAADRKRCQKCLEYATKRRAALAEQRRNARHFLTAMEHLVLRPLDYVTKLVSGLLTGKLPLDGDLVAVHATGPGPSLLAQGNDVSDTAFA